MGEATASSSSRAQLGRTSTPGPIQCILHQYRRPNPRDLMDEARQKALLSRCEHHLRPGLCLRSSTVRKIRAMMRRRRRRLLLLLLLLPGTAHSPRGCRGVKRGHPVRTTN